MSDVQMAQTNRFEHLVFDLDDTLLDTYRQLIPHAAKEACNAMINAGLKVDTESCLQARDTFLRSEWRAEERGSVYTYLVDRFGVRDGADGKEVEKAGYDAFHNRDVEPDISLFPGARELLHDLRSKYILHLVTAGHEATQRMKILILGLESTFDSIHIVDPSKGQTKGDAFKAIMAETRSHPSKMLSIGNRLDTDIAEAKRLGWKGCWIRYGEHAGTRPSNNNEAPDFSISNIQELVLACRL